MPTWIEPEEVAVPIELQQAVGGHPLVAQTLVRRGLRTPEAARAFLDPALYSPVSPYQLPDLEVAVRRLEKALATGEPILVWGDFDVDGQTATALLVSALRQAGAQVSYHIPVRARESHGVSVPVLQEILAAATVRPGLLLTCDTGVAAHPAVEAANQAGLDVIITDHHELPTSLPPALAVINPRRLDALPEHPLRGLPGVGVAYKLVEALYECQGREAALNQFLDLAALGCVADVAPLVGETRALVQRGLGVLRQGGRLGLRLVCELAGVAPAGLSEEHLGFILGPRLNAIGRLGDANPIIELLTTDLESVARPLAVQLEALNAQRQLLTSQVYQGALAQLQADPALSQGPVLLLAHATWPAGVVGIVASRLVEQFHKPVLLVAAPPGQPARGSARSIEGVDVTALLATQADLLTSFGGHRMAAGFSLPAERLPELRRRLNHRLTALGLPAEAPQSLDGCLPLSELSLDLVQDLERLAPFGSGNPPLRLLSPQLKLVEKSFLGGGQEHLLLILEDEAGKSHRGVWWHGAEMAEAGLPEGWFDLVYTPRTSTFRGQRQVQVEWLGARLRPEQLLELQAPSPGRRVLDWRVIDSPEQSSWLSRRLAETGLGPAAAVQLWAEGTTAASLEPGWRHLARGREALEPCQFLVIWSIPPGRAELLAALEATQAAQVALCAVDPQLDAWPAFTQRLAGLVKYALRTQQGRLELSHLVSALAQRLDTVRQGLRWLAASGSMRVIEKTELVWRVQETPDPQLNTVSQPDLAETTAALRTLLAETAAFRQYYQRAEAEGLLKEA